jgi:hypothetical protein
MQEQFSSARADGQKLHKYHHMNVLLRTALRVSPHLVEGGLEGGTYAAEGGTHDAEESAHDAEESAHDKKWRLVAELLEEQLHTLAASSIHCPSLFVCWVLQLLTARQNIVAKREGEGGVGDPAVASWVQQLQDGVPVWLGCPWEAIWDG